MRINESNNLNRATVTEEYEVSQFSVTRHHAALSTRGDSGAASLFNMTGDRDARRSWLKAKHLVME